MRQNHLRWTVLRFTVVVAVALLLVPVGLFGQATVGSGNPMALAWVINGDGASHNIALQYRTSNASDAVGIVNGASGFVPSMVFILSPSN